VTFSWQWLPGSLRADVDADPRPVRSIRDTVVDVAAVLVAAVIGWLSAWSQVRTLDVLDTTDLVVGVLACLSLLARRRWPFGLPMVLAALTAVFLSPSGAAAVGTLTTAVHCRPRATAWVAGVGVVASFVVAAAHPTDLPFATNVTISVLLTAVVTGLGTLVRARRQLVVSLAERARLIAGEQTTRVAEARRMERTRLAREMHDVLAHRMSLLSVHAGALEFNPGASQAEISRAAGVIRSGVHQMLVDLREVIGLLRESPDEDLAPPALDTLVAEARQAGADVTLTTPEELPVSTLVSRAAYRIVQEGLTNARKHAPGLPVTVSITGAAGDGLTVEVRQPLPARRRSTIPGAGVGLTGLTERATLAGGTLEHGPDGGDYVLRGWLPWEA
jgi:signal transduction histidine kinase